MENINNVPVTPEVDSDLVDVPGGKIENLIKEAEKLPADKSKEELEKAVRRVEEARIVTERTMYPTHPSRSN